jgi:CRP-like cAMP-binding protein
VSEAELLDAARRALGALPLLAGLPEGELERLAAIAVPFSLEPGELLFREGDPGDRIYIEERGRMEAVMRLPGGRELEALPLGPGELIGEMAALAQLPRQWSVRAVEPAAGWSLDARTVGLLLGGPEALEVAARLGALAVARLRAQDGRLAAQLEQDTRIAEPARPSSLDLAGPVLPAEPEDGELDYLETILFFSAFEREELEQLTRGLRRLHAPRGATLIAPGDRPAALLAILRGAVETTVRRGGAAARARLAGPGRFVGHLGALDSEPSPVTCRARERTVLLEIPVERVGELIRSPDRTARRCSRGVYADVVDALYQAQRPLARMAARGA